MDQVDKLILRVEGEEKLKDLNAQLETHDKKLRDLLALQKQGPFVVNPDTIRQSAERVKDLTDQVNKLKGQFGISGYGVMGLSYAFQDFFSVLSSGGKLDLMDFQRALMSVSNNIDQIGRALGFTTKAAAGMMVAFTGFTAAIPVVKALWDAFTGATAEDATKRLETIRQEMEKVQEAFQKLKQAPTGPEAEAAKRLTAFLQERPQAEEVQRRLASEFAGAEEPELLPAGQQRFRDIAMRISQIEARGPAATRSAASQSELMALRREFQMLQEQGRMRGAARIVQQAQVAGPTGEIARRRVFAAGAGMFGIDKISSDIEAEAETKRLIDLRNEREVRMTTAASKRHDEIEKERKERHKEAQRLGDKDFQRAERDAKDAEGQQVELWKEAEEEMAGAADWDPGTAKGRLGIRAGYAKARADREAEQRERYMAPLRGDVARESMAGGYGMPTAEETEEVAGNALAMMQQGAGRQEALFMSIMQKVQAIYQQEMMRQALMSRMQAGTDQSGQFSYLAPYSPY